MKQKLFLLAGLAFLAALFAFTIKKTVSSSPRTFDLAEYKKANIVRCTPDWEQLKDWLEDFDIPPIPGAGIYTWKISTGNDSAQFYFNQGINMYYAFHIIESMASFKKAAKFDPTSAMLQWAQALAYGPNINDVGYAASPEALETSRKAVELSANCSDKEKILIQAQLIRYSPDSTQTREHLNQLYVDKMKEAYQKYPADADVAALYADALMLQHPWDLWRTDGTPKPWTPLIRDVLEKLLANTPDHPGANHYYIHVMEPSPYADKALPSANRMGRLTPGLSHTVHMPSHIYLRTGYYNKGVEVNEDAVNSYKNVIPLYSPVTGNDFLYIIHNLHMQTNNSMMAGRMEYSVRSAMDTRNSIPKEYLSSPGAIGNYIQYIYMTPLLVDIRFGRWNEILQHEKPSTSQAYATVLYHFARGMAFSRLQKMSEAANELDMMREAMKDSSLYEPLSPFSPAIEGARVAEQLLLGQIHIDKKLVDGAVRHFRMADSIEIAMVYNEPRDWLLSPKHILGDALLKANKWREAEKVFQMDLQYNSENGWSLMGLHTSLLQQKKRPEAKQIMKRFNRSFEKADIKINSSIL